MSVNTKLVASDGIVSRLRDLGLSHQEALAFTTLLSRSNMTANMLCRETGIPDSKIYYALEGLSRKGMISVQKGNPNIYRAAPPKDVIANLKAELVEKFNEKTREADALTNLLTSVYNVTERSEELELAYIIRGHKNIVNRMKALIHVAQKELAIFVSQDQVYNELEQSLIEACDKRGLVTFIAVTQEIYAKLEPSKLIKNRQACCTNLTSADSPGMLITDGKTLLTVANWIDETAILTQDPNIVRVCRSYFDNTAWCQKQAGAKSR